MSNILRDLPVIFAELTDAELYAVYALVDKELESRAWFIVFAPPGLVPDLKEPINRIIEARNRGDHKEVDRLKAVVMADGRIEEIIFNPYTPELPFEHTCLVKMRGAQE